jgi:chromosomal replication initiation ATPase DnaA
LGDRINASRIAVTPERVSAVISEVASELRLHPGDIRGPSRRRPVRAARVEAWKRLAKPNVSIASIARAWPCHHATILNGLGRIKKAKKPACR